MFKTALIKMIIPHTCKLANIVPIPKANKDTDKGTSYRPISLLSVIAKTLDKSLLPLQNRVGVQVERELDVVGVVKKMSESGARTTADCCPSDAA